MKWCNPCALVWVAVLASATSTIWVNGYLIVVGIVVIPLIAAFSLTERDVVYWTLQGLLNEAWLLSKNKDPKQQIARVAPLSTGGKP